VIEIFIEQSMLLVPWRYVQDWNCTACGLCCKGYDVVLDFPEWIKIVKDYGVGFTRPGISRFFLKRKNDDTCAFLYNLYGHWLCGLQENMKPIACKLWPFKISDRPKFGRSNEAAYRYSDKRLFVYVDPFCPGLRLGYPSSSFIRETLSEFIELAVGLRRKQFYSTSKMFSRNNGPFY
jgi:Fe-S-cluster containining protein